MRQIKFRGKNSNDEWVYGSLITNETENEKGKFQVAFIVPGLPCASDGGDFYTARMERVKVETVGQYTGLTDKDGKEIYDGDIVECVSWNEYFSKDGKPMEPFRRKMFVDYRKGGFKMVEPMPEPMEDREWDIIYNGDIVVIGNIHDDPQLIDMKRLG